MSVFHFLARDIIYTSRAYAMMPVRLSVTEVHWRLIANLGFKFRSHFALALLLAGGSSRAMVIRNYHWLNSASRVLISTCSAPLVQIGQHKQTHTV